MLTSDINLLIECDKLAKVCKSLASIYRIDGQAKNSSMSEMNVAGLPLRRHQEGRVISKAIRNMSRSMQHLTTGLSGTPKHSITKLSLSEYSCDFTDDTAGNNNIYEYFQWSPITKGYVDQKQIPRQKMKTTVAPKHVYIAEFVSRDIKSYFNEVENNKGNFRPQPCLGTIEKLKTMPAFSESGSYASDDIYHRIYKNTKLLNKACHNNGASISRKRSSSVEKICKNAYDFIYDFDDIK